MIRSKRISFLVLVAAVGLAAWVGCKTTRASVATGAVPAVDLPALKPGPNDPKIAFVTARLLESYHYLQHPFDRTMSVKAFDGYVDALDPRHENFLQSDLDEFAPIRTNLDLLTVGNGSKAELAPVFSIYQRFAERNVQHVAYVDDVLEHEKLKFNTDEKIALDRRHDPFPKDIDEAKQLWRQRLSYEYLIEKLAAEVRETNGVFTVNLPKEAPTNIVAMLEKRYRTNLRLTTNWDSDKVLTAYLDYGITHAYDPHSDYFSAPKAADFSIDMNLALIGIGAQLMDDEGFCTIKELIPGGPAMKSKQLKPEDRIVAVAQGDKAPVDVVNMELEKVVQMIRGVKNTEVRLTISPVENRSARRIVSLVREEIKLEDKEAHAQVIQSPDGKRLGVIELPSFYAPVSDTKTTPKYTSVDVTKLLERLKQEKVEGIILDLRGNPGGSLEEAVRFTGLFIKDGPVVLARDSGGHVTVDSDPDPGVVYDGPLIVMLNRFSASASEIAAAALQDYGRAVIVGDISTHGKGTVQQLQPLRPFIWPADASATNDPGELKITKGKFYRISGGTTQLKGVASDIVLPDILNHSTMIGEGALDNALAWDTIQPVHYDKLNLVEPFLAELQRRSLDRVATNQEYIYIRQDIEQFKKNQADKAASLNEHEVITEREHDVLRDRARDKERTSRPLPEVKVYEFTVKSSAQPELPAPKSYFVTNTFAIYVQTNWAPNVALYTRSNSITGESTNYFGALPSADDTNAPVATVPNGPKITKENYKSLGYTSVPGWLDQTNEIITTSITRSVPIDPTLEESANIMRDYISLLGKGGTLSVSH
ncbi:MAG TPA: carboxy terminal-processing peptidase [Verrucomicrobiae bacterium]|nr:carboxy terminal-processing peptidase [Verrucomicrobiae bacterium]